MNGAVADGSVVKTGSGSRYFLSSDESIKAANRQKAIKDMQSARSGATITLTKERKEMEARAASAAQQESRNRPTFSLFGMGGGDASPDTSRARQAVPQAQAPRARAPSGVPSIVKWRKNFDGSITGFISGSPNFSEGEKVTTSPITGGTVSGGQVVKTGSGSRYFLV